MKEKIRYILASFLLTLCYFAFSHSVFATESIKSFDVELTASKDGLMQISEKIVYDFGYYERHGVYRYIPTVSNVGDLYRVSKINFTNLQRDGESEPYSLDTTDSEVRVKIGSAGKTMIGTHIYLINYTVENGIGSNYEDHDEIYWNVTGNGWEVPIEEASLTLKTDFNASIEKSICFTGPEFSTQSNCTVEVSADGTKISTTQPLFSNEGLTIVSSFPVNTFPKSILQTNTPQDPDLKVLLILWGFMFIICNLIIAPLLIFWYKKHKNKKRFGKVVVNFDLPQSSKGGRITPSQAGTIDTARLDQNDIVATFFDLAIRKYILIEQIKEKGKFLGIGTFDSYKLTKLKSFDDLTSFEKSLEENVFGTSDTAFLKDTSITYDDFTNLEKENFKSLIEERIYTKNPKAQMSTLLVFGILLFCFGNIILGPILIILSRRLNGRTQIGDELDYKIDGLKLFLKGLDRYHTWQAKNLLFLEKMIPYAISLGYIDEFMEQLKLIKPDYSPTWYTGHGNFFISYNLFSSSMTSNITTSASSSSSGFSSGSSGGGGGGGGGGSW